MVEPTTIEELADIVTDRKSILPVGGKTKDKLCDVDSDVLVSTKGLSGITSYDPSEYTITALAGTPVKAVNEALEAKGQYLPFSPVLVDAGATLGGTVASGLSGSGRFRYGGIRDFLLGITMVGGTGTITTSGGRVVKNAAGFDLPKLMVGSLGRLGILAEMTFKVFPAAKATRTVQVTCASHANAVQKMIRTANARWELEAIDYRTSDNVLFLRVGAPEEAVDALASDIASTWKEDSSILNSDQVWRAIREFEWVPEKHAIAKVPVSPKQIEPLIKSITYIGIKHFHLSAGGAQAWLAIPEDINWDDLNRKLSELPLSGLVFKGRAPSLWIGQRPDRAIDTAIAKVFDPDSRFLPL